MSGKMVELNVLFQVTGGFEVRLGTGYAAVITEVDSELRYKKVLEVIPVSRKLDKVKIAYYFEGNDNLRITTKGVSTCCVITLASRRRKFMVHAYTPLDLLSIAKYAYRHGIYSFSPNAAKLEVYINSNYPKHHGMYRFMLTIAGAFLYRYNHNKINEGDIVWI